MENIWTCEDKVKGVMDEETFVLLNNQFKKERDQLKGAQQKSRKNLRSPRNSKMVSHVLRRRSMAKLTSNF